MQKSKRLFNNFGHKLGTGIGVKPQNGVKNLELSVLLSGTCTRQGSNLQPCDPKSQESMFNDVRESPHLGT